MSKPKPAGSDPICGQMRKARQQQGWSLETASREVDIPVVVMGSWERGDRNPPLTSLRRWVEAFGRHLVVLEPDEMVIGADRAQETFATYHVVIGRLEVDRDTRASAEALARDIPGAKVGYRVHRRGPLEFGYWTGEM